MIRATPVVAAFAVAAPAMAQSPPPVGQPVVVEQTLSGQPIRAPGGDLRITVGQTVIAAGAGLPPHKHPYPRLVQVLAGRLKVTNLDTGQVRELAAGEWVVDAVDQWHSAEALGGEPVRLLTIDQAPPGAAVTILRRP
ncbi:cupin domain-containing protein [Phenylobacterium kunshanense]|uniref:Cupin n=1 Tax=Phenylobacterium kunshanense TaxID=1445034 RepID=A0A328BEV6_9CAUL|nr:cupin domain-containing protein [Phenylobacterium kunshanense]RAK65613.1 cupin [Phenylobacterium kunshanense]